MAWIFEQAYLGRNGSNYWWVAPYYGTTEIAYRRTKRGLPEGLCKYNDGNLTVTLPNDCTIWYKSGDRPDSLYGEDVYAAVIDEASRCREEAFFAIRSTLTATRGPMRMIGNVKGKKNWFYNLCRKAEAGERGMAYYKIIAADAVAAGVLSADEVEDARRLLPAAVFNELYLAQPSDDGSNPFGDRAIKACIKPISQLPPVAWGWDLAKHVDWTVGIGLDRNGDVCRFLRFQRPWPDTLETIKRETKHCPAYVDSTGVGDPIVDMLQKDCGSNFEGFQFTLPAKQRLMEGLAVAIQNGETGYPEGAITSELDVFEFEYTRTGVRYSAPEGAHDDCVCALALAVAKKSSKAGASIWEKYGRAKTHLR